MTDSALHIACIGLGSNLGDSVSLLRKSWEQLCSHPAIQAVKFSSLYGSQPFEMESEKVFVNAVGLLQTSLGAEELLHVLLDCEHRLGRKRDHTKSGYQDRLIDLDLLLFDTLICSEPELTLPHPHLHRRRFVLDPLAEIAPSFIHPIYQKTVLELRDALIKEDPGQEVFKHSQVV